MRILWVAVLVILLDQASKLAVYLSMHRGQSIPVVGDWLRLTYTENPGMAFGITFGPEGMVTAFAIVATILIIYYLYQVRGAYWPYRMSLVFILGGAIGNIIDRIFYGVAFGYGQIFQGRVIDFIHVNVWRGMIPEWIPFLGGTYTALFPIWNVADMAIVVGVVGLLAFQHHYHEQLKRHRQPAYQERGELPPEGIVEVAPSSSNGGWASTSEEALQKPANPLEQRRPYPGENAPEDQDP